MPLSASDKEWYVKAINGFAKKNDIAVANSEDSTIVYSQELSTDEAHVKPMDPEEMVHALVLQMLVSDQFKYPRERLYHEKYYAHGSKGSLSDEVSNPRFALRPSKYEVLANAFRKLLGPLKTGGAT